MTKTLSLNTTSIKFSDDKTDLIFIVSKDGQIVKSNITPTLKIKQVDKGYLTSIVGAWADNHIVVSSSSLNNLPVGQYLVELWLSDETGDDIYPDTGFIRLGINQNSTGLSGDLVSSITLQDFQSQFNDLSIKILNNLPEGKVGPQGPEGPQGQQGIQGVQGQQGGAGKDFSISKTFSSVTSMSGDGVNEGDFVMISSTIEDPDNAKLYVWNGTAFTFVTDMSGATGIKGDKGEQGIQGEQGIHGVKGADAVITVITQAEYDKLPDKSGVYFIGG